MFNKGFGLSVHEDPFEAGRRASQRALGSVSNPGVCLVFVSVKYDIQQVVNGIRSVIQGVPLFGASSSVFISNAGFHEKAVEVIMMSSQSMKFDLVHEECVEGPEKTAENLARKYLKMCPVSPGDVVTSIILGTESHFSGIKYLEGINKVFPFPLPVSGGGSIGPQEDFFRGFEIFNDQVFQNHVGILFMKILDKDTIRYSYSFESKWEPIAPAVRCTKAVGSCVSEVDELPVMTYMKMYLGENFKEALKHTAYKYTFIARLPDEPEDKFVIRTPGYDLEQGTVRFFPDEDMQGIEIQLVQLNQDELLNSARISGIRVSEMMKGYTPELVLVFSCHLRHALLHSRSGREVEMLRKGIGENVPIAGMYCAGEFAPLYSRYEDIVNIKNKLCGSRQFSTSLTLLVLASAGEKSDPLDYFERVNEYIKEDNSCVDELAFLKASLEKTQKLLTESENVIVETERAFRCINNEHYSLAMALQKSNGLLVESNKKNERLQKIIRQYTPHNVWKKAFVTAETGKFAIPDEELHTTLMFLDIKGFTTFAENHPSWEVIEEINRIFEPVTTIIYQFSGDVDKFIGDCIFAVFETATDAVRCSFEIHSFVKKIDTPFLIRIGINGGRVISGNVGGRIRKDNTLIGDAVNLAQRLESNCTPGCVLVSRDCFLDVPDSVLEGRAIVKRSLTVKGKTLPVEVYEISG